MQWRPAEAKLSSAQAIQSSPTEATPRVGACQIAYAGEFCSLSDRPKKNVLLHGDPEAMKQPAGLRAQVQRAAGSAMRIVDRGVERLPQ